MTDHSMKRSIAKRGFPQVGQMISPRLATSYFPLSSLRDGAARRRLHHSDFNRG